MADQSLSEMLRESRATPLQYFNRLFEIRNSLHFTHLAQLDLKLSTHMALGEIYECILPVIDGLVEGYMGTTGTVVKLSGRGSVIEPSSLEGYLRDNYDYLRLNADIFKDSWMKSEIDLITKTLAIGLYKVKFVK